MSKTKPHRRNVFLRDQVLDYLKLADIRYLEEEVNLIDKAKSKRLTVNDKIFRIVVDAESCMDRLYGGYSRGYVIILI